jgi:hypothetical protein
MNLEIGRQVDNTEIKLPAGTATGNVAGLLLRYADLALLGVPVADAPDTAS